MLAANIKDILGVLDVLSVPSTILNKMRTSQVHTFSVKKRTSPYNDWQGGGRAKQKIITNNTKYCWFNAGLKQTSHPACHDYITTMQACMPDHLHIYIYIYPVEVARRNCSCVCKYVYIKGTHGYNNTLIFTKKMYCIHGYIYIYIYISFFLHGVRFRGDGTAAAAATAPLTVSCQQQYIKPLYITIISIMFVYIYIWYTGSEVLDFNSCRAVGTECFQYRLQGLRRNRKNSGSSAEPWT